MTWKVTRQVFDDNYGLMGGDLTRWLELVQGFRSLGEARTTSTEGRSLFHYARDRRLARERQCALPASFVRIGSLWGRIKDSVLYSL